MADLKAAIGADESSLAALIVWAAVLTALYSRLGVSEEEELTPSDFTAMLIVTYFLRVIIID
jgi:hypothetical protein